MSDQSGGRRWSGVSVAGITALVSGVSVFVNSYGLRAVGSPTVYTTAKNLVAAAALGGLALATRWSRTGMASRFTDPGDASRAASPRVRALGVAYVGLVGGGFAFVLFFNGLAASSAAPAAFWRDSLVVWVALLAGAALGERVRWWNVAAIVLVVAGQVVVTGGVGPLAASRGELEVLASSVLWAIEVVIVRGLLRGVAPATVSVVRMGGGSVALLAYVAASGGWTALEGLGAHQWLWVAGTGLLLAAYVATWMTALARARALDVTSVLVGSALLTWVLQALAGTALVGVDSLGLVLVGAGVALVVAAGAARAPRVAGLEG